jgi:hypothetical protein
MIDEMFDSSVRSKGDLVGVFEYDGETAYFYLYETGRECGHKVVGAIRIMSGDPDFEQADLVIHWDAGETKVGLFIRGELCAAFESNGAKYGGDYRRGAQAQIPTEILLALRRSDE